MNSITTKIINKATNAAIGVLTAIQDKTLNSEDYSNLGEHEIINNYLKKQKIKHGYCIDIAASDGVSMSNTYALYKRGWHGLAVEFDAKKFSALSSRYNKFMDVNLAKCMVTPINIIALLEAHSTPYDFEFLNLDIDGYDYFVLEKILTNYRPKIICVEINEKIPPPIKFTVKWDEKYTWASDHFYGQSISQLYTLVEAYDYALVKLHYNNAFLIPSELSPTEPLTPEEAYRVGYLEKPDRKQKFPWNSDLEEVLHMEPLRALEYINNFFGKYAGKFEASI